MQPGPWKQFGPGAIPGPFGVSWGVASGAFGFVGGLRSRLARCVLFGQPELDLLLRQSHLRQLSQRITFSYDISSLSAKEVAQYIQHRLITAGYGTQPLFSAAALRLITQASGGIPRLINILANKALLVAFGKGQHRIKPQHIRAAIRDSRHAIYILAPATAQPGWLLLALGLGAVASASLLGLS